MLIPFQFLFMFFFFIGPDSSDYDNRHFWRPAGFIVKGHSVVCGLKLKKYNSNTVTPKLLVQQCYVFWKLNI